MGADAESITPQLLQLLRRVPVVLYIAEVGPTAPWLYVSPQIDDLLGFTPEQWCGDPEMWARQLHPDDRDRMLREESEARAARDSVGQSEYRLISARGSTVWVSDDAKLVQTPGGLRWHGVLTDITDRRRVQEELLRRADQQAAVARLGEHALEGKSPLELMQEALAAGSAILGLERAAVLEHRPGHGLQLRAGIGWPPTRGSFPAAKLNATIEGRSGRYGLMTLQSESPRELTHGDADFVQALANVLADALGRQAIEDEVVHRSTHDALTGLPNRALFVDRVQRGLARARRSGSLAAVLFLDLDHFKLVNDTLGHHVGDRLLTEAGRRIRDAVRGVDAVARFGGDEFAILLEELDGERAAVEIAERIGAAFGAPFSLAGQKRFITTSIGIAFARGRESPDDLIRDADAAMYRSKEQGRARWELFDERMRARVLARVRVENDLRRAVERDQLMLHYQPIVSLPDGELVGAEALLRWRHPRHGEIPTRDFVAIAEETGMIEEIGRWVLESACREAAGWSRGQASGQAPWVAVNLSPIQLRSPGLTAVVTGALERAGLDPARLRLELTESVMIAHDPLVEQTLEELRELGVGMVLDDFGTGYSSLGYLTRLPLQTLKLDRSFVEGLGTDPRRTAIAEAISAMAHALGLQVIGEGIESSRQAAELHRLGCRLAQGYWFCRPVEASQIVRLLREAGQRKAVVPGRSGDTVAVPHS